MAIGIYDTAELAKVIRTVHAPTSYWLDLLFPTTYTFDSAEVDFDYVDKNRRLAPFVAPTAQGVPLKQQGFMTRKWKPAYIKPKDMVDPARNFKRRPGEALTGSMSPQQREDMIVADIVETHRFAIERTWEWMACEAAVNGAITVSSPDYPTASLSFGRDASLSKNLTAGDRWSETTSKPLVDIENWMQTMHRLSGYTPTRITMGVNAWNAFKNHASVKDMLDTRRGSKNALETGPGAGLPWQYRGSIDSAGGLEVWTYNDIYEDANGNSVNYLDQDTVVLTSPAVEGVRAFGAIMDRKAGYVATPIFGKMWEQDDPSGLYLMHQSAPLMIPTRPNASMKAKVLNAA